MSGYIDNMINMSKVMTEDKDIKKNVIDVSENNFRKMDLGLEYDDLFGDIITLSASRSAYLSTTSNIRAFNKIRANIARRYLNKPGNEIELFDSYLMDLRRVCIEVLPRSGYNLTREELELLNKITQTVNKENIKENFREVIKQETKSDKLPKISREFTPVIKDTLVDYGRRFEAMSNGQYMANLYVEIDVSGRETLDKRCVEDLLQPYKDFRKAYQGLDDVVGLNAKETGYRYIMDCDDIVAGLKEKRVSEEQIKDFYKYMTDLCKSFLDIETI